MAKRMATKEETKQTPAEDAPQDEQRTFSGTFNEKTAAILRSVPRSLRGGYIVECVEQRIKRDGPPSYTEAQAKAAGKATVAKRVLSMIENNPELVKQLQAMGFGPGAGKNR